MEDTNEIIDAIFNRYEEALEEKFELKASIAEGSGQRSTLVSCLRYLLNQIETTDPVDSDGHSFKQNDSYTRAKKLLDGE